MSFSIKFLQTLICSPGIGGRRGLRALFWGKPGVGKTAQLESLAKAMGAELFTLVASTREPSDFLGIPMPDGRGGVEYAAPSWAYKANENAVAGGLSIIFLDELTTCALSVQKALLRVVNEGWVGEIKLHPNVVFIAAANPPECSAGGYDLPAPSANRWMHLDWHEPSVADFSEGLLSNWEETLEAESATSVISRIEARLPSALAKAKGVVTGFLRGKSQHLINMPDESHPDASKAWPSPRMWDLVVHTLAGCEANGVDEADVDTMLEGCVGRGVAGELRQFISEADLPDPEALLDADKPSTVWAHNPERPDLTIAVLNTCAAFITSKKAARREERAAVLWGIIGTVVKSAGDVAVLSGRVLAHARLTASPQARQVLLKLKPVMAAMGDL